MLLLDDGLCKDIQAAEMDNSAIVLQLRVFSCTI